MNKVNLRTLTAALISMYAMWKYKGMWQNLSMEMHLENILKDLQNTKMELQEEDCSKRRLWLKWMHTFTLEK